MISVGRASDVGEPNRGSAAGRPRPLSQAVGRLASAAAVAVAVCAKEAPAGAPGAAAPPPPGAAPPGVRQPGRETAPNGRPRAVDRLPRCARTAKPDAAQSDDAGEETRIHCIRIVAGRHGPQVREVRIVRKGSSLIINRGPINNVNIHLHETNTRRPLRPDEERQVQEALRCAEKAERVADACARNALRCAEKAGRVADDFVEGFFDGWFKW